eukprot:TRINITY_DN112794_c0_g1_i1.p1 TRINITY_DN112794_c0_g1~~TRINITY_DN112794_c0_g1_i1.p1  ORF type:complete len:281 (+),score=78.30 TRINITY_DN112794_c0_g1_i1:48-845(+)
MQRGQSDTDLVSAVRRAASEVSSSVYSSRRSQRSGSEASLVRSRHSKSSRRRRHEEEEGLTLEQQQKAVQDAAFQRYVQSVKEDAKQAVVDGNTWTMTVKGGLDEEQNEKNRRRELCRKNQQQVMDQMEHNKARRAEARREFIEAASSHSYPLFTETFISLPEVEEYHRKQKEGWRKELDAQKVTNDMLRNIEIKKYNDAAIEAYHKNVKNMTKARKDERDRLVNQGKELVNSWSKDVMLKDLKRAIEAGKDVVKECDHPNLRKR